ncbi:MAG: pyruvate decarboxylase [Cruoricaptor ignavus]|nr:pyruvate decarboxylase [Cruoricaptor ignavus]MDO5616690.1 pyruvate decarboxylase [Cruoricaptor ignavus]
MKKILLPIALITAGAIIISGCMSVSAQKNNLTNNLGNLENKYQVVYFNPEINPDVEEIKQASYLAFFNGVSNKMSKYNQLKMLRVNTEMPFDSVDVNTIKEICKNNNSEIAIVPKIKYFKVGIGKYVFSNQVVVSMKVFDAEGNLISEASHDTFKRNKRMLGSTENSIKIGTEGVMNDIIKNIRQKNRQAEVGKSQL